MNPGCLCARKGCGPIGVFAGGSATMVGIEGIPFASTPGPLEVGFGSNL